MKQSWVRTLEALSPADINGFGGKAVHLSTLLKAGFPVPPAFCISSSAFRRFAEHNDLRPQVAARMREALADPDSHASKLNEIRTLIKSSPLVPTFTTEVAEAYSALRASPAPLVVSVRSSARSEDSSEASFAGQHDSVLNVQGLDTLYSAIKEGWASFFSDRAVMFRRHRRQPLVGFEMGLIVQQMIEPEVSGVLFTVNPMTGSYQEMLLEAGWGLGEAFVSGQLSPDTFFLSRSRFSRLPSRVRVLRQRIAEKTGMLKSKRLGTGELEMVDVPSDRRNLPALDKRRAAELGRVGLEIERLFGAPQDIEWAIDGQGDIYILQARPITALISRRHRRKKGILWTQRFSGERWTEPVTPLSWSIIQPVLHHFIYFEDAARKVLEGTLPTRVINGHPYFNISIFRHLLWKFPAFAPPQFVLEFFPKEEQDEVLAAPYVMPDLSLIWIVLAQVVRERRWARYQWNFLTNHEAWQRFMPVFEQAIDDLPANPHSPQEARAAVQVGQDWIREYVKIHLLSLLFANLYYQALASLLNRWAGEGNDRLLSELVADPSVNKTVETNLAMWRLVELARPHAALCQWLTGEGEKSIEELEAVAGSDSAFYRAWERFLAEYGHRSVASWEIFSPRWKDQPLLVLQLLGNLLKNGGPRDPVLTGEHRTQARRRSESRVLERLGLWHPHQRVLFRHVLHSTQKYMALRENQRFCFDMLLFKIKQALETLGRYWVEEGLLAEVGDLTLLTLSEVDGVLAGQIDGGALSKLIDERKEARARELDAAHSVFMQGVDEVTPLQESNGNSLSGLGISPGRVTGPARVLHSLAEMNKLKKGDILVTRATDPGWTPLFLTAGGLITELGSLLSHGAVVAREYGLPAVVNIPNATGLLRDGQRITVDGHRGVVYLHPEPG